MSLEPGRGGDGVRDLTGGSGVGLEGVEDTWRASTVVSVAVKSVTGLGGRELQSSENPPGGARRPAEPGSLMMPMKLMCQGRPRAREVGVSKGSGGGF